MSIRLPRNLRRRLDNDRGFSLVEVSVAMVIVMIVFAALLAALLTGIASARNEQDRAAANQIAADAVENLRVIDWDQLGFYGTDFPGGFPGLHNGESVVKVGDTAPSPRGDAPLPVRSETVNGVEYDITTWVTWAGSSAASPNDGTDYASKRISVDVTWSVRGNDRSVSTTGLRSPTVTEMAPPFTGTTTGISVANATVTADQTLSASYTLTSALHVNVDTPSTADFVRLTWLQDGSEKTIDLVPDATKKFWTKPADQLLAGAGPFPAGTFTFTFTAGRDSGETQTATANVNFTAPAGGTSFVISSSSVTSAVDPNPHVLDYSYRSTSLITVAATTSTMVDTVTATYKLSSGEQRTVTLTTTNGGTVWSGTVPVGTGPFFAGSTTFHVVAKKGASSAIAAPAVVLSSPTLGAIAIAQPAAVPQLCEGIGEWDGKLPRQSTLKVNVKNVSASDTVVFGLVNGQSVVTYPTGTGVSAGTEGFTFSVALPAGTAMPVSGNQTVRVSVSRSDDTSQVAEFTVPVVRKGNGAC